MGPANPADYSAQRIIDIPQAGEDRLDVNFGLFDIFEGDFRNESPAIVESTTSMQVRLCSTSSTELRGKETYGSKKAIMLD